MQRQKMETSIFHLQVIKCYRAKLWNSWQGNVSSYPVFRSMETLSGGDKAKIWNLDRSQKSPVLYNKLEVKPKTSEFVGKILSSKETSHLG